MSHYINRRAFVHGCLTSGSLASAGRMLAHIPALNPSSTNNSESPNEKLNIAAVGVANKGHHNIAQLKSENIVALCDVDENFLNKVALEFPEARLYRDYRKMFDAEANHIDAVVVSTPDHMHAPATSVALDLGKHAYCEKPLTHTVAESRALAMLASKNKLATQMGIQIHAVDNYRRVVELVRSGAIGNITSVYNWCNKNWSGGRFDKKADKPNHLDWNQWLGPAKSRPYFESIHPANWRRFWEYGAGTFGDMACHAMDLSYWALDLRHPKTIHCDGPEIHADGTPAWTKATYEFVDEAGDEIKYHWSDGNAHFDVVKETLDRNGKPLSQWGLGILFVGSEGKLVADYGQHQLLPSDKFEGFEPPEQTIPKSEGHWNEWVRACKTGSDTTCNFDYSGALTEMVLLGVAAYRSGEKLEWDAKNLRVTNSDSANELITKEYRKGFEVIGLDEVLKTREAVLQ